jgi:hypothetical protein
MRFMPLPVSIKTLPTSYPPICAFNTMGACPGRGTFLGWSALLNPTAWSDQLRYSIVAGCDVMDRFTCLDILFCSLFWLRYWLDHCGDMAFWLDVSVVDLATRIWVSLGCCVAMTGQHWWRWHAVCYWSLRSC